MTNHPYSALDFPANLSGDPVRRDLTEGLEAVKRAHKVELEAAASFLSRRISVFVVCDKSVSDLFYEALKRMISPTWVPVNIVPPEGGRQQVSAVAPSLVDQLGRQLRNARTDTFQALWIRHLDLMCWTAEDRARSELNDVVYWLREFAHLPKLACWDPAYTLPRVVEELFPHRLSLEIFSRELLWQLVASTEAKKLCNDPTYFTIPAQLGIYQYLSGVSVVAVRRILRGLLEEKDAIPNHDSSGIGARVRNYLRARTSPHAVLPEADWGNVSGYPHVRNELKRKVVFPFRLREGAKTVEVLKQADALVPRGVILYGPPGTGKTEQAKKLARDLGATLFVIQGPELKNRFVGETEAAIRRIFATARRAAPSLILIDELDSLTPARQGNESNFEASMVAQFLTEMDGLNKDEAVLVVGTTNRLEAVDNAFKRPSRFGTLIEVGFPDDEDRKAILEAYDKQFALGMSEAHIESANETAIDYLVQKTRGPLDAELSKARGQQLAAFIKHRVGSDFHHDAGSLLDETLRRQFGLLPEPQFSGDHLRAICLFLLRESRYRQEHGLPRRDLNDTEFLNEAVHSVAGHPEAKATSTSATLSWLSAERGRIT